MSVLKHIEIVKFFKNRSRNLEGQRQSLSIALDNYVRDYKKALVQVMKVAGVNGMVRFYARDEKTNEIKPYMGRLVITPVAMNGHSLSSVPYVLEFVSASKTYTYHFVDETTSGNIDVLRYFNETVLPKIIIL
ncbi:MAG: hypothetical protein IJK26_09685 [Clostridia bacterium]|nr:hypothetical protein [Clostridia bacterium]